LPAAVLIVNYRVYTELDRALASLQPSLRADDEVVVVDQVTDDLRRADLARRHPGVTFVGITANVGFARVVNMAARHSRAPYLMLLNPDAVVTGPVVDELERWLHRHPDVFVAGPRVIEADGSVQASARRFPGLSTAIAGRSTWLTRRFPGNWLSRRNLPAQSAREPAEVDWLAASCLMTRRDVFDRLSGFDEAFFLYWEDADFCRRAVLAGGRCMYLPGIEAVRHAGGASAAFDRAASIRTFHKSAFVFYRKHAGRVGRVLAPLVYAGLWLRGELICLSHIWPRHPARSAS
jgi:N-acetylglucosaminyl-diphospho-decaprenol L-rhamnosyltransferase